jgi:predicted nucleic acid-binding protein
MAAAESAFAGREYHLPSDRVFAVIERGRLSACNCEFVALAEILGVPLVTEDRAILAACPSQSMNLERFMADQ